MIVFLLGLSIFLNISDAYVMLGNNAQEEPKSITMLINGQDSPDTRRHAAAQKRHATDQDRHETANKRHRKRNSQDVLEDLYNNAPESGKKKHHGGEMRSKNHNQQLRSNEMDISKIVNGVINYFSKSPIMHNARSASGSGAETKIDLVKLVNGAFTYLASLNPKANNMRARHLEPKPIELRSKDETSLLYEINPKSFVEDVNSLLSSKTMKGYVDTMARKAATIYRAVTKDE